MKLDRKIIYSAAFISFLFSYLIHHPLLRKRVYSDVVSFWFRPFITLHEPPYIQASFEYPPLAGFITYVSALMKTLTSYYTVFSLFLFVFYIILIEVVIRISSNRQTPRELILIFLALSPSIILYTVYNFDIIFASLLILSLYLFERKRHFLSAILFSVAAMVKLVNLILLPFILMYVREWRSRALYAAVSLGLFGAVNLALWAINPKFIDQTYLYHFQWGLENAWFIALFPNPDSWNTAKLFSAFLLCYGLLKVYLCDFMDLYQRTFMALSVFLLTNYVFTPQMVLWILPLLAILGALPYSYFALEFANAGIILTWFESPNPTRFGSIPQYFAILRGIVLFLMIIEIYQSSKEVVKDASLEKYL